MDTPLHFQHAVKTGII